MRPTRLFLSEMTGSIVVALVRSPADQLAACEGAGDSLVQFCSTGELVVVAISDRRVAAVAVELDDDSSADLAMIQRALARRVPAVPLLIRFDLRRGLIRTLLEHDVSSVDIRFSLRGHDDLAHCVRRLVDSSDGRTAHQLIISRVVNHVRVPLLDVVTCATIVGGQRSTVQQLADLCRVSARTVEERLADAGTMGAKRLLMRMLALHTHWRVSRSSWTTKRAASAAGFGSSRILSRRIERTTGLSLAKLFATRSFEDELDRFGAELG
jgi:hypothetical protein